MKNRMNKKLICLTSAALILVAGLSVGKALAYFTTYTEAEGGIELDLGYTETIPDEKVIDGAKQVIIRNTGDYDCYVRMKALVGSSYVINYAEPGGEGKWTPGADGFYYYSDIVPAKGGETTQINVNITFPSTEEDEVPNFNVIIIQECTPVLYKDGGEPYADWTKVADVSKSVITGEEE